MNLIKGNSSSRGGGLFEVSIKRFSVGILFTSLIFSSPFAFAAHKEYKKKQMQMKKASFPVNAAAEKSYKDAQKAAEKRAKEAEKKARKEGKAKPAPNPTVNFTPRTTDLNPKY